MAVNQNISKLDLSNRNLDKFPVEILNLKNLKKLNLSNNKLKQIPKEIEKLNRLENLDLSNNSLINIYSNTCNLNRLQVLNLSNNQLKTLPSQIQKLNKLKKLIVAGNKLKILPAEISKLKDLESLNLSNNCFDTFPYEVLSLEKLRNIWINGNKFIYFPAKEMVQSLSNLKAIYCFGISRNEMDGIDKNYKYLSSIKGNSIIHLRKTLLNTFDMHNKDLKMKGNKNKIFISYARKDDNWLEKVEPFLKSMQNEGIEIDIWSDKRIRSGDNWKEAIDKALEESYIALLIVSTNFLASDFIQNNELPSILEKAETKGTKVLSLIASPCRFKSYKNISKFQSVNDPNFPLSKGNENEQDEILLKLTYDIEQFL